jgi:hypothetical protein
MDLTSIANTDTVLVVPDGHTFIPQYLILKPTTITGLINGAGSIGVHYKDKDDADQVYSSMNIVEVTDIGGSCIGKDPNVAVTPQCFAGNVFLSVIDESQAVADAYLADVTLIGWLI